MAGIRLEWAQFGDFESFDVIRSNTSMASIADEDLPSPIVTGLTTMYYVDTTVVLGATYYYKVRANRDGISVASSELMVVAHNLKTVVDLIFSSSEKGFAFDFGNINTMFKDVAGTIPVTSVGDLIACVLDLSGHAIHLIQSSSSLRPVLKYNATSRKYYADFSSNKTMESTANVDLAGLSVFEMFAAVNKTSVPSELIVAETSANYNSNSGAFLLSFYANGDTAFATRGSGSYPSGYNLSAIPAAIGGAHSLAVDLAQSTKVQRFKLNKSMVSVSHSLKNSNQSLQSYKLYVGSRAGTSMFSNAHFYSMVFVGRALTSPELSLIENYSVV